MEYVISRRSAYHCGTGAVMSRISVKKTHQQFQTVLQQLEGKLGQLQTQRESLDTRAFVVVEEVATPTGEGSGLETTLDEPGLYHGEVNTSNLYRMAAITLWP